MTNPLPEGMSGYAIALTHSVLNFPEALRHAAFEHLSRATGHPLAQLQGLFLQQPQPVVATVFDEAAALRLQADLQRGGWQSEVRRVASSHHAAMTAARPATLSCHACRAPNPVEGRFCAQCGTALAKNPLLPSGVGPSLIESTTDTLARVAGLSGVQRFSIADLLSEVFKRRTTTELEDYFMTGTLKTTPAVRDMVTDWSKPWLFARLFLISAFTFLLLHISMMMTNNSKLLPALMIVGCFIVPFSALLLLYELNAARNVSWMLLMRLVIMGGALSLLLTLGLNMIGNDVSTALGASSAGIIEETAKLAAVLFATRKLSTVRYRYILNGVVFGAAVGTGFAIFESAGYAFDHLYTTRSYNNMLDLIFIRGILSPFCHTIWTAMAAGALWRVKGGHSYCGTMLADWRFLRIFVVNALCHMTWNSPFGLGHHSIKYLALGFIAWAVALSLIQEGLRQIHREQQACGPAPA